MVRPEKKTLVKKHKEMPSATTLALGKSATGQGTDWRAVSDCTRLADGIENVLSADLLRRGNEWEMKTKMAPLTPEKPSWGRRTDLSPACNREHRIKDEGKPMLADMLASAANAAGLATPHRQRRILWHPKKRGSKNTLPWRRGISGQEQSANGHMV